jgi:hypothetical protein
MRLPLQLMAVTAAAESIVIIMFGWRAENAPLIAVQAIALFGQIAVVFLARSAPARADRAFE